MKTIKTILSERTIQLDLMVALTVFAIVPVSLVNAYYYYHTRTFIQQNVTSYSQELVQQTGRQIETVLLEMDIVQRQITSYLNSSRSRSYLEAKTPGEKVIIATSTESFLRDVRRSIPPNVDIYVNVSDGSFYTTNPFVNQSLLRSKGFFQVGNRERRAEPHVFANRADYFDYNEGHLAAKVVSFVTEITVYNQLDTFAVVQIDLDFGEVRNIVEAVDFGKDALVYIQDSQGNLIFSSLEDGAQEDPHLATSNRPMLENALTYRYPIKNSDWELTVSIPDEHLSLQLKPAIRNWMLIIVVAAAFSVGGSYALSKGITNSLRKLVKAMEKTGEGIFSRVSTNSRESELIALCDAYNRMMNQIEGLMENVKQKETEKSGAQLKALEAQINPHFLYNTLETMRSIAVQNKLRSVAEISKSLAEMFRYSIDKKKEFVTLEEELGHVRNYISIQQERYGDRIHVDILVDDELLRFKTIKLILQPLVENAVVHGLELKAGSGRIMISGYVLDDNIYISVVDNGLGINPELVEQLNYIFQGEGQRESEEINSRIGLGLSNVDKRIKHYYGSRYGLWLDSQPGAETVVRVCIPVTQ